MLRLRKSVVLSALSVFLLASCGEPNKVNATDTAQSLLGMGYTSTVYTEAQYKELSAGESLPAEGLENYLVAIKGTANDVFIAWFFGTVDQADGFFRANLGPISRLSEQVEGGSSGCYNNVTWLGPRATAETLKWIIH